MICVVTTTFCKGSGAALDYDIDWSDWLIDSETIVTSEWAIPTGITKDNESKTTTTTTIWLSGGTLNTYYLIENTITTATRTEVRAFNLRIVER